MDGTSVYIINEHIRLRVVTLSETLDEISGIRGFTDEERENFGFAALLAAALASDIKDDDGSILVSLRLPLTRRCFTAFCETDGRLRGYADTKDPDPLIDGSYLLTVGRRLSVRGDYTSTVSGQTAHEAAKAYYTNSNQTKADIQYQPGKISRLFVAEYLPGHDVNTVEAKDAKLEDKIAELSAVLAAASENPESPGGDFSHFIPLSYGCTCSKRKLRVILEEQGVDIAEGTEAECRLCGKIYRF